MAAEQAGANLDQTGGRSALDVPLGIERTAVSAIPVVDFSAFLSGDNASARAAVAREIRKASIDIGFFQLVGHGISKAELEEAHDWGLRFFALPFAEKMKVRTDNSSVRQGYIRTGGVDPTPEKVAKADLKERFGMAREVFSGEPTEGRYSAGQSQWPDPAALPGFEPFMKAHLHKRVVLAQRLARAFALSLDLPEHRFDEAFRYPGCSLFFNFYPALALADLERQRFSFSPHTDYGAFTLLSQDSIGGLQVRNSAGAWVDVPPLDGALVVNIGDMFALWTNDVFTSSLHRALNSSGGARVSLAFFFHPNGATTLRCLETCHGPDRPPRYPPVMAEHHMRALVEQMNKTGRPGLSAPTVQRLNG